MSNKTLERTLLWVIKIGLFFIPLLPLYISSTMLFPFITGKNFAFRIIVEIIFALWAGLAYLNPEYRPRLTPIFKALTAFIAILFLADLFSPNPYRAFFSNYERMEGFMMLSHLYLYAVLLLSVFKSRRDWMIFFHVNIAAGILISAIGMLQKFCGNTNHFETCRGIAANFRNLPIFRSIPLISKQGGFRIDSTIGNPAYLAAYLLFHLWMLLILAKEFWQRKKLVLFYGAVFFLQLAVIYFTATRGAILALLIASFLFLAALVLFWRKVFPAAAPQNGAPRASPWYRFFTVKPDGLPAGAESRPRRPRFSTGKPVVFWGVDQSATSFSRGRLAALAVLVLVVLLPFLIWGFRSSHFVSKSPVLSRLSTISFSDRTIQSRFDIWQMSFKGALERPILGWGQESYYLVFQKYFDPGLFAQEPWFDRSHDIIFDWLIHAGFLGLFSYLSILGLALYGIIKGLRQGSVSWWEGLSLLGLFSAHFLQNIFVFDNLNTYLLFFAFLGFTDYILKPSVYSAFQQRQGTPKPQFKPVNISRVWGMVSGVLIAVFIVGYFVNIKPILASRSLIKALTLFQGQAPLGEVQAKFDEALSYNSSGNTEIREQMANAARMLPDNARYSAEQKKVFIKRVAEELEKQAGISAPDVKHLLFLGSILNNVRRIDPQDTELNKSYAERAEKVLQQAVSLSPTKQIVYFELAQFYLTSGDTARALEVLKKGWELNHEFPEASANLIVVASLAGQNDVISQVKKELDITLLHEDALVRLGTAYQRGNDLASALQVYEQLVVAAPVNPRYRAIYAALLANAGKKEEAVKEANEAARLDPSYQTEAEQFIKQLKSR